MNSYLALLGGFYSLGAIIVFFELRNAPEGYEDETGFNVMWQNNNPDATDVACVWDLDSAHPAH